MAGDVWFERLEEMLTEHNLARYAVPIQADIAGAALVKVQPFGLYDAGGGNWLFNTSIRCEVPRGANMRWLFAMTTGTIRYQAGISNGPGTIVLARGDMVSVTLTQTSGGLPYWYPQPAYIVYENIDPTEAQQAAQTMFGKDAPRRVALASIRWARNDPSFDATDAQLADLWMRGEIPKGLPVFGGDRIGSCGAGAPQGALFTNIRMVDVVDPPPTRFYNPAYFLAMWAAMGWLDTTNPLLPLLTDTSGPPAASGVLRFVHHTSGTNTSPYQTPATASRTIANAVQAAQNGDTVLILDQATYTEAVIIDKPIALTSASTQRATDANPNFPTLDGQNVRRPITIRNVNAEVAHVSKLRLINGLATAPRGDGGGLLVERAHNVVIGSCLIQNCYAPGNGTIEDLFAEGFGGGIATYHASPAIIGCVVENNRANARGSGIGIWGFGWPAIFDCIVRDNHGTSTASNARPDGGGIGIMSVAANTEDAQTLTAATRATLANFWDVNDLRRARQNQIRITNCQILNNEATDDGGGFYASAASRTIMRDTLVRDNRAGLDGGGIRLSFGSTMRLIRCVIANNQANLRAGAEAGGGGISSRNSRLLKLEQTTLENNWAHSFAGGGLYFISSTEGYINHVLDFDWNDIVIDIYLFREAVLEIDAASVFDRNRAEPGDHGKGGALYVLRFMGNRPFEFGPLQGPWGPNGEIIEGAAPIKIFVEDIQSLRPSNQASFQDSHRLYLDDMVAGPIADDTDLGAPPFTGNSYRYP
jgi:hypothetical protein